MKFCSECGNALILKVDESAQRERAFCAICGCIHYENPKLLVWCLAHWYDKVLLCRRAIEPALGLWNPPSGFVEAGESLEQAAAREMREEAGLDVSPDRMVLHRVASLPHMNQVYIGFHTELTREPTLTAGPEVLEVRLFSEIEIPVQDLAFRERISYLPHDLIHKIRRGDFVVESVTIHP